MRPTPYRWTCALVFALLWSLPVFADTQNRSQAEEALKEGVKAYKEGRYEDALTAYQRSASLAPEASGPYREMGKAYEALGRDEDALLAYSEYLRRRPDAEDASEIKGRIELLESRQFPHGTLLVSTGFVGGQIWIDGELAGTTPSPSPLKLAPGTHQVEIRYNGEILHTETLTVAVGEAKLLTVEEPQDAPIARKKRPWLLIGGGVALVGLGVGLAFVLDELESGKNRDDDDDDDDDDHDDDHRRAKPRRLPGLIFTFSF